MNAYTISRLAESAGVSVHVARDYITRGLLHPARRTESGYGIFDDGALERLRFVRMASQAGIGLNELGRLCHALDNSVADAGERLDHLRLLVAARRETLALLDRHLATMALAASPQAEAGCAYA